MSSFCVIIERTTVYENEGCRSDGVFVVQRFRNGVISFSHQRLIMEKKARNFRNYKVWQDALDFATRVYKVTSEMPWLTLSSAIATRHS